MRTTGRLLVAAFGSLAIALALYNAFAPPLSGDIGLRPVYREGSVYAAVDPKGSAWRAGIRDGERIEWTALTVPGRLMVIAPRAGSIVEIPIARSRGISRVRVTVAANAFDYAAGRYIDLALVVLSIIFAYIVIAKATENALSHHLTALLVLYAMAFAVADYQYVGRDVVWVYAVADWLQFVLNAAFGAQVLRTVAQLPIGSPTARHRLTIYAPILGIINTTSHNVAQWIGVVAPPFLSVAAAHTFAAIGITYAVAAGIYLLSMALTVPKADSLRVRWSLSSLVFCWFFGWAAYDLNGAFIHNPLLETVLYYFQSFSVVGPLYATLRHRLVDLNVIVSLSAIYGIVSIILLSAFIVAELFAGQITDKLVGQYSWHGIAAQVLSFPFAIALGISARRLHRSVEQRVNTVFFRDRIRRLASLQSFVRESDHIESRPALLNLTFEAVAQSSAGAPVALYVLDSNRYARVHTSDPSLPDGLDKSDRLVLQVLDRTEPFQSELPTLHDWLIVPLRVRAAVIGFVTCGTKADHTPYLPEETKALNDVAYHVATSYALIV